MFLPADIEFQMNCYLSFKPEDRHSVSPETVVFTVLQHIGTLFRSFIKL